VRDFSVLPVRIAKVAGVSGAIWAVLKGLETNDCPVSAPDMVAVTQNV
jgi:hypothetical protein